MATNYKEKKKKESEKKESEHAFVTIEKDLKSGKIPNVVLLCGSEEYLIEWYARVLTKRFVSDVCRALDLVQLEGENLSLERITEGLETVSLMSERKVVFLPDFLPAAGKFVREFTESDGDALAAYLPQIAEGSMLLMCTADQNEKKTNEKKPNKMVIRKAVEKCGKVYDFQPLKDKQLRGFIEKRLRASGKSYRPSVVSAIIAGSGYGNKAIDYDLYNLDNDLKKIIAYSGDEITAADAGDVISINPENNVFAMLDAIGRNRKDEALRLLHNLLESGTPAFKILYMITGQLELILSIKEMKENGMNLTQIQEKLKMHQFRVKKAAAVCGNCSVGYLKSILSEAYQVDEHIKTGLFSGQMALEYFIARL